MFVPKPYGILFCRSEEVRLRLLQRAHKRGAKISLPRIQETQLGDCGDVEEGRQIESRLHGMGSLIKVSRVCLKMHQEPYGIGAISVYLRSNFGFNYQSLP
jgi:hypothetical protein